MSTEAPLYWLSQIEQELSLCKKIPLWGNPPPFPWEELSKKMGELLGSEGLRIHPTKHESMPDKDPFLPFGISPKVLCFQLTPLPGTLTWVLASETMAEIISLLLPKQKLDKEFQEGFYQFILLQACKQIEDLAVYKDLHIQWLEEKAPKESSFFIDVFLTLEEKTFPARILFSAEFQEAFSSHFLKSTFSPLQSPVAKKLDALLKLEAGNCLIAPEEWKKVKEGDFLILDRCTYDPETGKGTLDLSWEKTPLFKVKIKKNNLKILDYAVYNGDAAIMSEDHIFSDKELQEGAGHLWEAPVEDELAEETLEEHAPIHEAPLDILSPAKEIPFPLVVEVDRMNISLEKLLQLQPGNVLEFTARPEQGVSLTVHGKKIATGELIKLGNVLGVKIREVGGDKTS